VIPVLEGSSPSGHPWAEGDCRLVAPVCKTGLFPSVVGSTPAPPTRNASSRGVTDGTAGPEPAGQQVRLLPRARGAHAMDLAGMRSPAVSLSPCVRACRPIFLLREWRWRPGTRYVPA
jgi:hypothetical protein